MRTTGVCGKEIKVESVSERLPHLTLSFFQVDFLGPSIFMAVVSVGCRIRKSFCTFTYGEDTGKTHIVIEMQAIIHTNERMRIATQSAHQHKKNQQQNSREHKKYACEKNRNKLPYAVAVVLKSHHEHRTSTATLFFLSKISENHCRTGLRHIQIIKNTDSDF